VERQRFSRWREYRVTPVLEFFLDCFPAVMLCTPVPNLFKIGLFLTAEIEQTRRFPPGSAKRVETHVVKTCENVGKATALSFSTMSAHMRAKRRAKKERAACATSPVHLTRTSWKHIHSLISTSSVALLLLVQKRDRE
jgi:hypothetical protein